MHKLVHDLQFAATKDNYYLRAYNVDVDNHGYDLILDCGLYLRKFQVKTVLKSAQTRFWNLQAGILQPSIDQIGDLSIWGTSKIGLGGGLIVMEFDVNEDGVNSDYFYTDLDHISLLRVKWIGTKHQQKFGERTFFEIMNSSFSTKIQIKRSMLHHVRDTESLLELTGMQSRKTFNWRPFFRRYWGGFDAKKGLPPLKNLKSIISEEMKHLTITK